MNVLEFKDRYCNLAIKPDANKDIEHHGIKGQEWDKRRYQNLDGSLTPLGRIHYGVGMSREEMAEARAAEQSRQNAIDDRRTTSIREMSNDELMDAVNRSRNEMMFEKNMMDRSTNFLQSRNMEERLNMEYEEMQYQQSRLKAERFMGRIERLAKFGGNLATAYGKYEEMRGKSAERLMKENQAEEAGWKAKQQQTKYEKGEWEFGKSRSEYLNSIKEKTNKLKEEEKAQKKEEKAQAKAEKKAAKAAEKEAKKEAKKAGKDPEYVRKEGDTYIYDDQTKSRWQSVKDKISAKKEAKAAKKEAKAKREALKEEAKSQIRQSKIADELDNSSTMNSYFKKNYDTVYKSTPTGNTKYNWQQAMVSADLHKREAAKQERIKKALDSQKTKNSDSVYDTGNYSNTKYDWSSAMATSPYYNGGKNISKAALKRNIKRKKGSWS